MTYLEKLINDQVLQSVVGTMSRTTDRIAEEMAREILQDRDFRLRVEALIKIAFERSLRQLEADATEGSQ